MRRGRKCHYANCSHNEGDKKITGRRCKMFSFPKDPIAASQWLHSGGVHNLTPKRITAHNCFFCSCHFPNGKECGPEEYIEEIDWDVIVENSDEAQSENVTRKRSQVTGTLESPAVKNRRLADLTPSTRGALDGLMSLAVDHVSSLPKSPRYSPKKMLWSLRGTKSRSSCRRTLCDMMGSSSTQEDWYSFGPQSSTSVDENNNNDNEIILPTHSSHIEKLNQNDQDGSLIHDNESLYSDLGVKPLSSPPSPTFCDDEIRLDVNGGSQQSDKSEEIRTHRSIGIQCNRSFLSYDKCKCLPEQEFFFYTGVTQPVFEIIYTFIGGHEVCNKLKYEYGNKSPKRELINPDLTTKDKMFLTLYRLRRGLPLADLKILFNISRSHCSRIFYTWIRFLSLQFSKLDAHMITSASVQNELKPKCFEPFPNLRIIIDATEFKIQAPNHFQKNTETYSEYKNCNTVKFLVGISCFGGLSFLSEGYQGRITDRALLVKCGLLDHLEPGEVVMADRGFDIEDICDEKGIHLLIPAFEDGRTHFTRRELIFNRAIAVSRVHVETFIGKMKHFRLIRYVIPNTMLPILSDLVKVCAYLVNFQLPFIKKDDDTEFE